MWNQAGNFCFKYHVIDHKGLAPEIAVLGRLSIPCMAYNSLQEQNYSLEIRVLFQHELSKKTHVSYYVGIKWLAENNADVGLLYLISKNLQLVFMAGTSLIMLLQKSLLKLDSLNNSILIFK